MNFQQICMLVAGILLIIIFILIAISYNSANSKAIWPPFVSNCPDYFNDENGDGSSCLNSFNLGENVSNSINFKDDYPSSCDKYTYCNTKLLSWDGITYGYGSNNPCDTTSS